MTGDIDPASFRDPDARVFVDAGRIMRGLSHRAADNFRAAWDRGLTTTLIKRGLLVDHWEIPVPSHVPPGVPRSMFVEARRLPVITYPYEWSFSMLRDAALLTLDITEECLRSGFQLKDASAFNIQFEGAQPIMIDVASIERGFEGTWIGYGQFCNHFLAPLLLESHLGVPFQPHFRGRLSGLPITELAPMFSGLRRFKKGVFSHVYLRSRIERKTRNLGTDARLALRESAHLPVDTVLGTVRRMRRLVASLRSTAGSDWTGYVDDNTYGEAEHRTKVAFVIRAARASSGAVAWDVGANTGAFSESLSGHFDVVVAIDSDPGAVDQLYRRLRRYGTRDITPLVMDLTDPSPDRGWRGRERRSLMDRVRPDMSVWLAVIHHVCLVGEVPIQEFLDLVAETSPVSVVEFVDRDDPMSRRLMATRRSAREDYTRDAFLDAVGKRFKTLGSVSVSPTRELFHLAASEVK